MPSFFAIFWVSFSSAPAQSLDAIGASYHASIQNDGSAVIQLDLPVEIEDLTELRSGLESLLGCEAVAAPFVEGRYRVTARCPDFVEQRGLSYRSGQSLTLLRYLLRDQGIDYVEATWQHPASGYDRCTAHETGFWLETFRTPPEIRFGYGIRQLIVLLLPPLGFAITLVVFAGVKATRSARSTEPSDRAAIHAQARLLRRLTGIGFLGWPFFVAWSLDLDRFDFLTNLSPRILGSAVAVTTYLAGPALIAAASRLASHPLFMRMHADQPHVRPKHLFWGSLMADSTWVLPFGLVVLAFAQAGYSTRALCFLLLGAYVASHGLHARWQRLIAYRPRRVAAGELHDRVQELARTSGCELESLFLAGDKDPVRASAASASTNAVTVAEWAVKELSKEELDGIVAHEIAHVKHRDPTRFGLMGQLGAVSITGSVFLLWLHTGWPSVWLPFALTAVMALSFLMYQSLHRSSERRADREALAATGTPEALASGLLKITEEANEPLEWSRWDALGFSHPSTGERLRSIAEASGVPPDRLMARATDRDDQPSSEHYDPSTGLLADGVFSSEHKNRVRTRMSWTLTAVLVLVPLVFAWLSLTRDGYAAPVLFAGAVVTFLAAIVVDDVLGTSGYGELERKLRAVWERRDGMFVSFYPCGSESVSFEGFYEWDVGLLTLTPEALAYEGEKTSFVLPRNGILRVRASEEGPWPARVRAAVTFRSAEGDGERELGFAVLTRPRALVGQRYGNRKLVETLRQWLEASSGGRSGDEEQEPPLVPTSCAGGTSSGMSRSTAAATLVWLSAHAVCASGAFGPGLGRLQVYAVGTSIAAYALYLWRAGAR